MPSTILNVNNVSKSINNTVVARQVSFHISNGEIFGIIGPEKSGKSTIINMICGIIVPSCGKIDVCGRSIINDFENAIKFIGGSLENSNLYTNMTSIQNLNYFASLYGNITNKKERINSLIKLFELENDTHKLVKDLPKDKLQKLVLAQALVHYPKLLILDNPTKDLDSDNIQKMRNLLMKIIKKYNISVLVTSSNLKEVQELCDTIAVVRGGEILDIKTAEEIKKGTILGQKIAFKVNYPNYGAKLLSQNFDFGPYAIGPEIILKQPESRIDEISKFLSKNDIAIFGIRTINKTFEDIYNDILRKQIQKSQLK